MQLAAPVSQKNRILILDSLRGIAILGILLMNIPGFALPDKGWEDPLAMGEMGTINFKVYFVVEWIFEGTQRALFSMLFGAGMLLFVGKLEQKMDGTWPADYFARRQLWLLVFGLVNAYLLLWFWDILFHYAIAGLIIYAFRRMPAKGLLIAALVSFLWQEGYNNVDFHRNKRKLFLGEKAMKIDTTTARLTSRQKELVAFAKEIKEESAIEARQKHFKESEEKMLGGYRELYEYQSGRSARGHMYYGYYGMGDILMMMFLGMAFFKIGIFTGDASFRWYAITAILCLIAGLAISWYRLQTDRQNEYSEYLFMKNVPFVMYEVSRAFRAIGIFCVIMLMYKSGWFKWFFKLFQPVGQMAFTNYLMQSLIGMIYFYGIGFGMFAKLQRYEIYIYVAVVYVFQIVFSHVWLRFFRFGPLEWAWRSLTYWKLQPMAKQHHA